MEVFNRVNDHLREVETEVLAPPKARLIGEDRGFKLLDADSHLPPLEAEMQFLDSLLRSDFGYIINPKGYMGAHGVTEIAIARLFNVPVMAMEPVDINLDLFSHEWRRFAQSIPVCSVDEILSKINSPADKIHNLNRENSRFYKEFKNIQDLSLYVMSADWLKYRGLGYLVSEVRRHRRKFLEV